MIYTGCNIISRLSIASGFSTYKIVKIIHIYIYKHISILALFQDFGAKHFSTEGNSESEREYIYKGILKKRIFMVKGFSILSSCVALTAQPFLYMQAANGDNLAAVFAVFGIVGVFAIGTPLFLHSVSKNYVTDLYYYPKEDKYLAELYTFFLRKKKVSARVFSY